MTRIEIQKIVNDILKQQGFTEMPVGEEKKLCDDLGMDSLDIVELGMELEKELHISIKDEQVETWETVGNVVDTVEQVFQERIIEHELINTES